MVSLGRSYELAKASFSVLKKDKEILIFPVITGATIFVALLALILTLILSISISMTIFLQLLILTAFIGPILFGFLGVFFEAAVIACGTIRLKGSDPKIRDGLKIAFENSWQLLQWAIIGVIVGIILQLVLSLLSKLTSKSGGCQSRHSSFTFSSAATSVSESKWGIGDVITGALEIAWTAATFFVIPVILYEKLSAVNAIKRSSEITNRIWGETFILDLGIGTMFVFIGALGGLALFFIGTGTGAGAAGLSVALAYWVALACMYFALKGILKAALYELSRKNEKEIGGQFLPYSEKFNSLIKFVNSVQEK